MTSAEFTKPSRKQRVRTLWISDVHLGTRDCQAEHLSQFLKGYQADKVYLVGDIIDGWKLRGGMYWPQAHTNVIRRLLTMAKRGTEVIYVTGNHDEFLRRYSKLILGNIQLVDEAVHVTADGRHLLVIHGDQFDVITRYHRWLAFLGDSAYEFTLTLNRWLNHWRARYGYGYWSLSAYLKHKVKTAVNFISDFEEAIAHEVTKREMHGVVCGHLRAVRAARVIRLRVFSGRPSRFHTLPQACSLTKSCSGWVNSVALPKARSTNTSPMTWRRISTPGFF